MGTLGGESLVTQAIVFPGGFAYAKGGFSERSGRIFTTQRVEQIRGSIDRHRDEFLNRYIAVQIESEIEDGRTSNGQWYPRVVTVRGYER